MMNKLKATENALIEWNKVVFGNVHKEVEMAYVALKQV